jgi:hypothetical protein
MSFNVHNGYIIKNMSVTELQDFFHRFQKKAAELKKKSLSKILAKTISQNVDLFKLGIFTPRNEDLKENIYQLKSLELIKRIETVENEKRRDPEIDFESTISFIFKDNKCYALFFCDNKELNKLWVNSSEVTPYPYWNSTDRPKDVSEVEWRMREEIWDSFYKNQTTPDQNGFSFVFSKNDYRLIEKSDCMRNFPNLKERAKYATTEILLKDYFDNLRTNQQLIESTQSYIKHYSQFCEKIQTIEFKPIVEETNAQVLSLLVPEIQEEDLWFSPNNKIKSLLKIKR